MGSQYAGDPSAFPVDFTIPDDGDDYNAASVNVAFEALGDRTANLLASAISVYDDFAALRAYASPPNKRMACVKGFGIYFFELGSTFSENAPDIIRPTDNSGRWFSGVYLQKGANYGLAYLGYDARLDLAEIPNAEIDSVYFEHNENVAHHDFSATWTDVPNTNFSLTGCKYGDFVDFAITGAIDSRDTPGGNVYVRLAVGTSTATVPANFRPMCRLESSGKVPFTLVGRYQVTTADEAVHQVSWKVQQQAALYASGSGGVLINTTLARLIRP